MHASLGPIRSQWLRCCSKQILLWSLVVAPIMRVCGQGRETGSDSIAIKSRLAEVVVSVFGETGALQDQPGSVAYLSRSALTHYNDLNSVAALNTVPGVRMELRSPGSMRLNIRGSTLRAPFGVREVKVYYNGIPFTDPGGNTYLNQLRFGDLAAMRIIKGPAGSMYGAGTGGVLLIESALFAQPAEKNGLSVDLGTGRFGLWKQQLKVQWGNKGRSQLRLGHFSRAGYRRHTRMEQSVAAYETRLQLNDKSRLSAVFHYSDLFYQTPGALTLAELKADRRAARPASGRFPSSETAKAAVHQKAFMAGFRQDYQFNDHWQNTTAVYGAYTDFTNPTVRNYEWRTEPHFGGRTVFRFSHQGPHTSSRFWLGAEWALGYLNQQDNGNVQGHPDSLQTAYKAGEQAAFVFAQMAWTFPHGWQLHAGTGLHFRRLRFSRHYPLPVASFVKKTHGIWTPRIALSKKVSSSVQLFADASKGFSPPTVAELLPSTNQLNQTLEAEQGLQFELGSRGRFPDLSLSYTLTAFMMRMDQSISLRRDSSGADYFVNAGGGIKKGLEAAMQYVWYENANTFVRQLSSQGSLTVFDYRYRDYQAGDKDFSGKQVPGTSPFTANLDVQMNTAWHIGAHLSWQHSGAIALDNANTVFGKAYHLLAFQLRYEKRLKDRIRLRITVGGDNLLNEQYSLGDDINAFGGRYFNAAPPVGYYANFGLKYYF